MLLVRGEKRERSQRGEGMSTSEVKLSASLFFMGLLSRSRVGRRQKFSQGKLSDIMASFGYLITR